MPKERLIVFTRYPEPGKAKTRLIPALGAGGAATLHRQMTEYTLAQVKELQSKRALAVEVRFAGGSLSLMERWLGYDLGFQEQGAGDLGSRMARSHASAFQSGTDSVVTIGTDCPGLDSGLMSRAFQQLVTDEVVLGPARDGGYYLIGLRRFIPELFSGITWGTAEVLKQTVAITKRLDLSVAYLPELADVDRPEDLPIWEHQQLGVRG